MSFDYTEIAEEAAALLEEFGAEATLKREEGGEYDPATGDVTAASTSEWTAYGVKLDYEAKLIDGSLIRRGDQRVYLSVVGMVNPQTGDTLTIGDDVFNVIESRPLKPATVAVLFDVQCRGLQT